MNERTVQVVEPTLEDYAGHCYSLVLSFCRVSNFPVRIWAARQAAQLDFGAGVTIQAFFRRRIRLLQSLWLLRHLLRATDPVVITTARRSDLTLVNLAARGTLPPNRVYLYYHWFRETPARLRFLGKIAARQPNLVILGTTTSVVDAFRRAGFRHVHLQPYPAPPLMASEVRAPFRGLLYAGAARQDKGFRQVVDLVALLAARNESIPIVLQVSADHYGKYDAATRADIDRLRGIGYAHLDIIGETVSPAGYAALFPGRICLQPYNGAEFRDRVSGVTLDALAGGCPVVATAGTWSAELIERFAAGVALPEPTAEQLYEAVKTVMGRYAAFQDGALAARHAQAQRSWAVLTALLEQAVVRSPTGTRTNR